MASVRTFEVFDRKFKRLASESKGNLKSIFYSFYITTLCYDSYN